MQIRNATDDNYDTKKASHGQFQRSIANKVVFKHSRVWMKTRWHFWQLGVGPIPTVPTHDINSESDAILFVHENPRIIPTYTTNVYALDKS